MDALLMLVFLAFNGTLLSDPDMGRPEAPSFVPGRILVRLNTPLPLALDGTVLLPTGIPALDAVIRDAAVGRVEPLFSGWTPRYPEAFRRHGLDRLYRLDLPVEADAVAMAGRFATLSEVAYAEPDWIEEATAVPNDARFPDQYGLDQPSDADMDGPEAWDITTGRAATILAILDSGIDSDHEELASGRVLGGWDFVSDDADPEDDNGHGTRVTSLAAGNTNNSVGIAGSCWHCSILPLKVLTAGGSGTTTWFSSAVVWATDNGASLINYSASGTTPSSARLDAIGYAYDAGVVLIGGAGNGDVYGVNYPKARAEFIATGATNAVDERAAPWSCSGAGGSRYGNEIDVVAPADAVPAANLGGGYVNVCGNSFSGPVTGGLIGLVQSVNPSVGRDGVRHILRSSAEDQVGNISEDTPGFDIYHGWGRVNMERALQATQSTISLRVDGAGATRVYLDTANPVASSYDFVRGDLADLAESWRGVDIGNVVCLENDSADADTAGGNEDTAVPAAGEGFFYLARFNAAPGAGSYGGSSRHRDRLPLTLSPPPWTAGLDQAGARFGSSVASAGDVNNDGFDDVIVGAELWSGTVLSEGGAFLFLGSASGLSSTAAWSAGGGQFESAFGWSVASAGDVNNDGFDDVIIGAPVHDNGELDEGRAYVFLGSASGLSATPDWQVESNQAGARLGWRVRSAGDVNNDGFDDVIVGAPLYDGSGGSPASRPDRGRAYVYLGSASGLSTTPDWETESDQGSAQYGVGVGSAGDVNNDGFDDVIVGAPLYDNPQSNEGRVYVYHGSSSGLPTSATLILEVDVAGAQFGYTVGTAGDVDNDSHSDVIIGANLHANGETQEGTTYLFMGSSSGITSTPGWTFESDKFYANLGISAATAGDTNNDGFDDVIVGAHLHDARRSQSGRAMVFLGSGSGLDTTPDWTASVDYPDARFGWRTATAGDVNGDGYADVIVGASFLSDEEDDEGRAYLFLGSASGPANPAPTTDCDP